MKHWIGQGREQLAGGETIISSEHIKLTIVYIYAPTEKEVKDEFYMRLQKVLDSRNTHDMLLVIGDMNTKVGDDN